MIDIGRLSGNPIALLAAAVVVLWVARALANLAFKVVLVLAVVGAAAIAGGVKLPAGMDVKAMIAGMQSGLGEAVAIAGPLLRTADKDEPPAPPSR